MDFNLSQTQFYILFILLAVLIFGLSVGITFFYMKIKKIQNEQEKIKAEYIKKEDERVLFVKDSIKTICLAHEQGQVETSEACIRLRMLIDRIDFLKNDDYPTIFGMYEEIRHFKTHESRKALSLEERTKEDKERFAIEDKHYDNFKVECSKIISSLKEQ